jgi:hypothetical protein
MRMGNGKLDEREGTGSLVLTREDMAYAGVRGSECWGAGGNGDRGAGRWMCFCGMGIER